MCGIWLYLGKDAAIDTDPAALALYARGPESTSVVRIPDVGIALFTRLAINGLRPEGMQPMQSDDLLWMCNGEIYNWKQLAASYGIEATSGSDCEIIGPLYKIFKAQGIPIENLFRTFDGVFACVIVDREDGKVFMARDPYGVRPLYIGSSSGIVIAASEIKALTPYGIPSIRAVAPGSMEVYGVKAQLRETVQYHTIPWIKSPETDYEKYRLAIKKGLREAVKKRMLSDRPVAALLSGGVDSSLVAALVAEQLRAAGPEAKPLNTFSIGFDGSSDLMYARKVAAWIGSKHHEIVATPEEFFRAIPEVIRAIESFDTTTVRASVGNYLVAKAVRELSDCKVVFNGDGSDEVFGSYLYFKNAPSDAAFEVETRRLLQEIHMFDVLRSDRSISSNGLEARTPFLDKQFVATAMAVPTEWRRPSATVAEKAVLRAAFADEALLPDDVLNRRKEAFSDGVSGAEKSWYELVQEHAEKRCPPDWRIQAGKFSEPRPATAEQFYYRNLYETFYPGVKPVNVPHFWLPKWCGDAKDPSARTLDVYKTAQPHQQP